MMQLRWLWVALGLMVPVAAWAQDEGDGEEVAGDDDDSAAEPEVDEEAEARAAALEAAQQALQAENDALQASLDALTTRIGELDAQLNPPKPKIKVPKLDLSFGGSVTGDFRVRTEDKSTGPWYAPQPIPVGISRLENITKFKTEASLGRFRAYVELDFVLSGHDPTNPAAAWGPSTLTDIYNQPSLVNTRFEAHAAYVEATDLLVKGLDVRIGQQLVMWGVGDQFNPTNTLNANDVEDPLLFGTQQANLMAKVDYTLLNAVTFSGVLIPLHRAAMTPSTGGAALAASDRLPYVDDELRWRIHASNALATATGTPVIVPQPRIVKPTPTPDNMAFAFRVATNIALQDLAVNYYYGRTDFPQANLVVNTIVDEQICTGDPTPPEPRPVDGNGDPIIGDDEECIGGYVNSDTVLHYPRHHVLGLNAAGEIPGIQLGYRLELGVYFPNRSTGRIFKPVVALDPTPPGEFDYDLDGVAGGDAPDVVSSRPFAKWSLGFDRALGRHFILNVMWVHGLVDEYGSGDFFREGWSVRSGGVEPIYEETAALIDPGDGRPSLFTCATTDGPTAQQCVREMLRPRIADYVVLGLDFNFLRDAALIRLFTLWDVSGYTERWWDPASGDAVEVFHHLFTPDGFSAVIYPEFQYNFGGGFEVHAGAMIQLGKDHTKFGDPAAGGTQVFFRGRYSW